MLAPIEASSHNLEILLILPQFYSALSNGFQIKLHSFTTAVIWDIIQRSTSAGKHVLDYTHLIRIDSSFNAYCRVKLKSRMSLSSVYNLYNCNYIFVENPFIVLNAL
jgi:hypothetical protein